MIIGFRLGQFDWKCLDWIKQVGVYTYWVLCIHSFEIVAMPWRLLTGWMGISELMILCDLIMRVCFITVVCILLKNITRIRYRKSSSNVIQRG